MWIWACVHVGTEDTNKQEAGGSVYSADGFALLTYGKKENV